MVHYAAMVHQNYLDLQASVAGLNKAIETFVKSPNDASLQNAKNAWTDSRKVYGLTEVYRFYGGPIDEPKNGPEGLINAWPLDESYIDGVKGQKNAGFINNPKEFPSITKELLVSLNEKEGEKNISTGYHAIEFLLWGQDFSKNGPGKRTAKDYVKTAGNNADRRAQALVLLGEILQGHVDALVAAWDPKASDNYAKAFLAVEGKEGLRRILLGMTSLSVDELAGERMTVPLEKNDQENEQSCFSDTTHSDFVQNARAVQNVYLGRYASPLAGAGKAQLSGPGISDVVKAFDPALDTQIKAQLSKSLDAVQSIPAPFDQVLATKSRSPARKKVTDAIASLNAQAKLIAKAGKLLGIELNVQE